MQVIESERLRVVVDERYGARVVSLRDKGADREWMAAGVASPNSGEAAVYGSAEAVGWDECFPTVGACDAQDTTWRRRLRDHGDLWGRPWVVEGAAPATLTTRHDGVEYRFIRTLTVDGDTLTASYSVENLLQRPLPYLWALHALLDVQPGDQIELPGVKRARASYLAGLSPRDLVWPDGEPAIPFSMASVQPRSANFSAKLIASGGGGCARVGRPGAWLELRWSPEEIGHLGLWFTYGGWFGHQEIAIEPTNAPADDLTQAVAAGAAPLAPGERRAWRVTMRAYG